MSSRRRRHGCTRRRRDGSFLPVASDERKPRSMGWPSTKLCEQFCRPRTLPRSRCHRLFECPIQGPPSATIFRASTRISRPELGPGSADTNWRAGDEDDLDVSSAAQFLGAAAVVEQFARANRLRLEKVEILRAIWSTDALQWYGRSFDPDSLAAAIDGDPGRLKTWSNYALQDGADGWSARLRLGSFFAALCEVAFTRAPALGLRLWRRLRSDPTNPAHLSLDLLPFRVAERSPACDEARAEILDSCNNDGELANVAVAAQSPGADDWLAETIERLILNRLLWRKAMGLALAGGSHLPPDCFDTYVALARIERTWVEDVLCRFRTMHRKNLWSRSWYGRFLACDNPDDWWSALQAFFLCGDPRHEERKNSYLAVNRDRTPQSPQPFARARENLPWPQSAPRAKSSLSSSEQGSVRLFQDASLLLPRQWPVPQHFR